MELKENEKQAVAEWVRAGATLAEVQKRLAQEFGISMTYMEVRFLLIDLGLELKDTDRRWPTEQQTALARAEQELEEPAEKGQSEKRQGLLSRLIKDKDKKQPNAAAVTVNIDRVARPASLASGTVRFSDGASASWWIDQFGRLALESAVPGYRPSHGDIRAFQQELHNLLEQRGL